MYATAWRRSFGLTLVTEYSRLHRSPSTLPARGIAAPTLEQLDEPREVKPGAGADQEMRMGLQEAETHDRRPLLESDVSKVLVEKRVRGRVDHGPPRQRGPGEVEENAVGRHEGAACVFDSRHDPSTISQRASVPVFPLSRVGPVKHCALSAVSYRAHAYGVGNPRAGRAILSGSSTSRRSAARACASSPSARPNQTASSRSGRAAARSSMRSHVRTRRNV